MAGAKHAVEVVETELEIDEELKLQELGWKIQRVGWILVGAFILAAMLGLFGNGIISKSKAEAGSNSVEFSRYNRNQSRMDLRLHVEQPAGNLVSIALPQAYLDKFRLESIHPEPESVKMTNGEVHYTFYSEGEGRIVFHLVPETIGSVKGYVRFPGGQTEIAHFIYP